MSQAGGMLVQVERSMLTAVHPCRAAAAWYASVYTGVDRVCQVPTLNAQTIRSVAAITA